MTTGRTPPAWRRGFLRELARSGSVALAADKCGIDPSSAYQLRKRNAAFAASWDRAQEAARARLVEADRSPSGLREGLGEGETGGSSRQVLPRPLPQAGGEARRPKLRDNQVIRASSSGRPCIVRAGPGRWSAKGERAFLAELTATANVSAAARAAGVSTQAAYNRRRLWPAFAEAWKEALAEGYVRIETFLLHAATASLDPEPETVPAPETGGAEPHRAPRMTVAEAMNLLKLHRAGQHGGKPQRYGWRQREPDIEDVRAEILRKVAAMERVRGEGARACAS